MKIIKSHKGISIFLVVILSFIVFSIWQNNDIVITKYEYINRKVTKNLDGFRIIHISDLHNKEFGNRLATQIKKQKPDIIVITGDLIDSKKTKIEVALSFAKKAILIAPVYYVTGNHESWSKEYPELEKQLIDCGVTMLDNTSVNIEYNSENFTLLGVEDPAFIRNSYGNFESSTYSTMKEIIRENMDDSTLNILLSHRPELIDLYAETEVDIVLSGHAHGGQVRIPFIGGLVAPDQGLLPKYTSGMHTMGNTSMVISRGLGNSIIPIRVFNRPEVVVITLKSE